MADAPEPVPPDAIHIELTEEQQLIRRLSGQFAKVLELTPDAADAADAAAGAGRGLQFRWRLSVASGIPRQVWNGATRAADAAPGSSEPKEG
jgi:hypothetical protein